MSDEAVTIRRLSKRYPLRWKRKMVVALHELDLVVKRGEIVGLLGPNGSGKSTTLKLILGLLRPTQGEIHIFGQPHDTSAARARLGFLPENPYFYQFLTGEEALRFYGKLCGVSGRALEKKIEELLKLVGLEQGRERPLRSYSKGMLQRIGLAQALIHDPELVLLDEPTAGVDPRGSRDIRDLILRLKEMGKTVIFSSHLLEQVEEVADRVAILHLGHKVVEGTLQELLTSSDKTELILSQTTPALLQELRVWVEQQGAQVEALRAAGVSLEQLFLRATEARR